MMAPLLRVLAALHARHILHRDIKPENIFFTHALAFKLGDMVRACPTLAPPGASRREACSGLAPAWPLCEAALAARARMAPGHARPRTARPSAPCAKGSAVRLIHLASAGNRR